MNIDRKLASELVEEAKKNARIEEVSKKYGVSQTVATIQKKNC